jgi:hypothetical protein
VLLACRNGRLRVEVRGPRVPPRLKGWWYRYRHLWARANVARCPVCDK